MTELTQNGLSLRGIGKRKVYRLAYNLGQSSGCQKVYADNEKKELLIVLTELVNSGES